MSKILERRVADDQHEVVTVSTHEGGYMRRPCPRCPWRKDAVGVFPAKAFAHSARTAHDMSESMFGCHNTGTEHPKTCAGFLLRGAEHNLQVRLGRAFGRISDDVDAGGHELHDGYISMAIANGVPADAPELQACRRSSLELDQEEDGSLDHRG